MVSKFYLFISYMEYILRNNKCVFCIKIMAYFQILNISNIKQVKSNKNEVRIPRLLPLPLSYSSSVLLEFWLWLVGEENYNICSITHWWKAKVYIYIFLWIWICLGFFFALTVENVVSSDSSSFSLTGRCYSPLANQVNLFFHCFLLTTGEL